MRHKKNNLRELSTGNQKYSTVVRTMMTNLVTHGQIVTTPKRAKVLKSAADKFFGKLVACWSKFDDKSAQREAIRLAKNTLFTAEAGKKAVNDLASKYRQEENTTGFVINVKL